MRVEASGNILTDECISLDEAKLHARVDLDTMDDFIRDDLIPSARRYAESYIGGAILPQEVTMWLDALDLGMKSPWGEMYWRSGYRYINLHGIPVRISQFRIFDDAGNPTIWNPNNYELTGRKLILREDLPWEIRDYDTYAVTYVAGYGVYDEDEETWTESVPADIKLALKMMITHWYQNPESFQEGAKGHIPLGVCSILDRYRNYAL
jgi:uncharacterized phiE125 gp8 family phage protein